MWYKGPLEHFMEEYTEVQPQDINQGTFIHFCYILNELFKHSYNQVSYLASTRDNSNCIV